jgi:hypothetical protein
MQEIIVNAIIEWAGTPVSRYDRILLEGHVEIENC